MRRVGRIWCICDKDTESAKWMKRAYAFIEWMHWSFAASIYGKWHGNRIDGLLS